MATATETETAASPPSTTARQVSVRALLPSQDSHEHDGGAAQYIISLPVSAFRQNATANNSSSHMDTKDRRPSPVLRKVSVQPALTDWSIDHQDTPPHPSTRRPTLAGFRSVSVRLHKPTSATTSTSTDGKMTMERSKVQVREESFHVGSVA